MDVHIVHQGNIEFKEAKNKWKSRWAILEKSDRNVPPEDIDSDNMRHSNYTSLVIRKNREGEVKLAIPLYYLCVVDKYTIDKKTYGIVLMVANKQTNSAETYLLQCDSQAETDVWLGYFQTIVGAGMHKFEVKLPKIIKKYNGPGWLYFFEEQKFVTITTDHKIPQYYGTWPIQLLRRYGGDDPNKFVFESGRRCFGGVNIYHVASSQAYDIRGLCNKVSLSRGAANTGCVATSTLPGYADTEPRYRNNLGTGSNPRIRPNERERPLTVVSNGSVASNTSKRSSGSSSNGDPARQLSLDRTSNRPMSDTIDSGLSFRSSNNSIMSNRSSRGSYSSDININEEVDSGVDTLESRNGAPIQATSDPQTQDMYMVMQPGGMMAPITETKKSAKLSEDYYETMVQADRQEGYTTLRTGINYPQQDNSMSNYMVPKPHLASAPHSPMSPVSPQTSMIPGVKHINYPATPQTIAQVPADNYMNMGSHNTTSPAPASHSNYMNIDNLQASLQNHSPAPTGNHSNYMNIDALSRSLEKSASVDSTTSYTNMAGVMYPPRVQNGGGSYGNYMNMPSVSDTPPAPARKVSAAQQPIYDTPTNHLRAYANVDNKCIAMSVSNPIYGNCGGTAQKLQT